MFVSAAITPYKAVVAIAFNKQTGMAKVSAKSCIDGKVRQREMPMCYADYHRWTSGELIQTAMHFLSLTDREFLLSGMTDEQWDATFAGGEAGKGN